MIQGVNTGLGKMDPRTLGSFITQGALPPPSGRSFFGKLWRGAVNYGISKIPILSDIITILGIDTRDFINRGGFPSDIDATLTIEEANYLENWFTNILSPKYVDLLTKANEIYKSSNLKTQVSLINSLNNELAILKEFLKWDGLKLSSEAIKQRNEIATELIGKVEHLIFKTLEASTAVFTPANVEIESTRAMLFPIIFRGTFKAVATNYTISTKLTPVDLTPVDFDPKNTIDPIQEETKKTTSIPWWVYVVGGLGIYKILK